MPSSRRLLPSLLGIVAFLAVIAWLIAASQAESRRDLDERFLNRVELRVNQIGDFRDLTIQRQRMSAVQWLADERISGRDFSKAVSSAGHTAAVALDAEGRVLHIAPRKPAAVGTRIADRYPHLRAAVAGAPAVSPVVSSAARGEDIIAFAVPFETPYGRRVFSSGYRVADTPLTMQANAGLERSEVFLLDDAGTVIASSGSIAGVAGIPAGRDGTYEARDGVRHYAQLPVPGTPWRVVMTVPEEVLYGPISGFRAWLPWFVLAAMAAAALAALRLRARRDEVQARLAVSEALHRNIIGSLPDAGVLVFGTDLRITVAEGEVLAGLGWGPEEVVGLTIAELLPGARGEELAEHHRAALAGETHTFEWAGGGDRVFDVSVSPVRDRADGPVVSGMVVMRDVTAQKAMERRLRHLADHDPLTGLWNRRKFEAVVGAQTQRCRREDERAALLVVDLDHFKDVNDTHGHAVGDALLVHVAGLLGRSVRDSDAVARLGGDEFAVLLRQVSPDEAALVAQNLRADLETSPLERRDGPAVPITASIGIAFLDGRRADVEDALLAADIAMYDAKAAGRNRTSGLREGQEAGPNVRVLCSDDSEAYRLLLREMLSAHPGVEIVGEARDAETTLRETLRTQPDVVLLDASVTEADPSLVTRLRALVPGTRVVMLTGRDRLPDSLTGETDGFLSKTEGFDEIVAGLR